MASNLICLLCLLITAEKPSAQSNLSIQQDFFDTMVRWYSEWLEHISRTGVSNFVLLKAANLYR